MSLRDFFIMAGLCLIWALNTVVSKMVVSDFGVEPLFYAAVRFALVTLAVFPWLFPAPRPIWRAIVVGLCMGGGTFALFFIGLQTSSPSAAAIVGQIGLPITTILSIWILGERIHPRRFLGIALAFLGVLVVMWHPGDFKASTGLLLIALGGLAGSVGAVMMKQMDGVRPLQFQAWVGLSSFLPLTVLTLLLEPKGLASAIDMGWWFVAAVAFSALVVSVVAHTAYYVLIQRYEANLIAPLTLMTPLATIVLGVLLTGDVFDSRMAIGTLLALTGVLIITVRRAHVGSVVLWLRERT
jgi:O-acetylserine/cysteine efflux transporter